MSQHKYNFKYLFTATILLSAMFACKKETNPYFSNGVAVVLTGSVTSIAPAPADSLTTVLTLKWSNPHYATDSSHQKFTIDMDSSGRSFAKKASWVVAGPLSESFTAQQLNNVLLQWGFSFGKAYPVDIRITSSYANNNEPHTSNVITVQMTPYKIPPKVAPPSFQTLFIIGGATAGGWNQPVPPNSQQFTQLDSVTYQGTFFLSGGGAYDLLPVNGSWTTKYNVVSNSVPGLATGGDFQFSTGSGQDIPAPAKSGIYTIKVDFQAGKFTVTPVNVFAFLFVPGDYQSWSPSTAPGLASIKADGNFEGYVNITTTGGFKFTSEADWNGTNYGDTAGNGKSGKLNAGGGNNLNIAATGYYLLQVNTAALTWSSTSTTWGLIGDFNSWSADAPMTYDATNQVWKGSISAGAAGAFKFRANGNWNLSYGTGGAGNSLTSNNGGNVPITAGNHAITLDLHVPGYYTYTIQ